MLWFHDRAPKGITPSSVILNSKGPNKTMSLAIYGKEIFYCKAVTEKVNTSIFLGFLIKIREVLDKGNSIISIDNIRFYYSNVKFYNYFNAKIYYFNAKINYLPRYLPFLNQCKEVFLLNKSRVRKDRLLHENNDLIRGMKFAAQSVTRKIVIKYFKHSKQFLESWHAFNNIWFNYF